MKNMIISALGAYIFYGFCEIYRIPGAVAMFFLLWALAAEIEEIATDYMRSMKRGKRLNGKINNAKGVRI